jgi:hypothetical protein
MASLPLHSLIFYYLSAVAVFRTAPLCQDPGIFASKPAMPPLFRFLEKLTYYGSRTFIYYHTLSGGLGGVLKFIFIRSYLLFQEKPYRTHLINPGTFHNKFKGLLVQEDNSEG